MPRQTEPNVNNALGSLLHEMQTEPAVVRQ